MFKLGQMILSLHRTAAAYIYDSADCGAVEGSSRRVASTARHQRCGIMDSGWACGRRHKTEEKAAMAQRVADSEAASTPNTSALAPSRR